MSGRAPGARSRGTALRLALRLPPPLGRLAVRAMARIAALARLGPTGDAAIALEVARIRAAAETGDRALARSLADVLLVAHPADIRVLEARRDVVARQGALTELARTLHRLARVEPGHARFGAERRAVGALVVTSPGWLPRIPGPPRPVTPADDVVLFLLDAPAPPGLGAARKAALRPVVVTALGFPRSPGVERLEPFEVVEGVAQHRLDLGAWYPANGPADLRMAHWAWLAAAVARSVAPVVLYASSGRSGFETALVGLALRDHLRRPLVVEVESLIGAVGPEAAGPGDPGEARRRRAETQVWAMLAADHVVTREAALRDAIVGSGVPPERVTVLADDHGAQRLRAVCRDILDRWPAPAIGVA